MTDDDVKVSPAALWFLPMVAELAAERLEGEVQEHRMSDSFGGYDWGDPICLWNRHAPRPVFTLEQWAIADRAVAS